MTAPPTTPAPGLAAPTSVPPIPDGVYRTEITNADIVAAGGRPRGNAEDIGTFTVVLDGGRFTWHQRGREPIFNPIAVGRYSGTADEVTFDQRAPVFNADKLSALRWRLDGQALRFTLPRCTGPAARDRLFCAFQTALFTAHPCEPVDGGS